MKKLFSLLMALCLLCAALPVVAENANSDRAAAIRAKFLEKADEVVVTDTSVIFTDAASETPLEITKKPRQDRRFVRQLRHHVVRGGRQGGRCDRRQLLD